MSLKLPFGFTYVRGVTLPQNYLAQPNSQAKLDVTSASQTNLESALESLDLKGLLVLNGLITQQALKVVLDSEGVMSKLNNPIKSKKTL